MFANRLDILIGGVFALGFGGFGLVMLLIYVSALTRVAASQNWPSVEGRIEKSRVYRLVGSSIGTSSSSFFPEVKYTYSVMGNAYEGSHIGFGVPVSSWNSNAKKVIARYPTGSTRTVYYDPQNPARAVLERKVVNNVTALIVVIACLLMGIGSGVYTAFLLYRSM